MGCAGSKSSEDGPRIKTSTGGSSQLKENDVEAFRERLFAKVGDPKLFSQGDKLIVEGQVRTPTLRLSVARFPDFS